MRIARRVLFFLAPVLLSAIIVASASGQGRTSGVSKGETIRYGDITFDWYSNDPFAAQPVEWARFNDTAYFTFTVETVVGANVSCSLLLHFNNGTEQSEEGWVDVATGEGENMALFLIASGLGANDFIYSTGAYSTWRLNATIPRSYPGSTRDTNYLNMTNEVFTESYLFHQSWSIYWDKATGILTEISMSTSVTTTETGTFSFSRSQLRTYTTKYAFAAGLTESNIWVIPEFTEVPQITLLFLGIATVTLVYQRKTNKPQ